MKSMKLIDDSPKNLLKGNSAFEEEMREEMSENEIDITTRAVR